MMFIVKWFYEKIKGRPAPYYYNYSVLTIMVKPIRKFIAQVLAPYCPLNWGRIMLYRFCGFKIGKHCFIGMRCYLDDMCYDLLTIGDNCIISYGVFFACHGRNQEHLPITIKDGVYVGMRASIISKTKENKGIVIGENAVIGACTLVNKNVPANATAVGIPCQIRIFK